MEMEVLMSICLEEQEKQQFERREMGFWMKVEGGLQSRISGVSYGYDE